jgi:hypothetical protein
MAVKEEREREKEKREREKLLFVDPCKKEYGLWSLKS